MLKSENRLTKRKEFGFVYKKGIATYGKNLTLITVSSKLSKPKFGFSISKKIGKAHTRNLLKRRLREIIKEFLPSLKSNFNYVFIPKENAVNLDFNQLKAEVYYIISKSDKLINE